MADNKPIMSSEELDRISKEVDCLSEYLLLLDPNDAMERQLRNHLWSRWNYLRSQVKGAMSEIRRRRFQVVPDHMKH